MRDSTQRAVIRREHISGAYPQAESWDGPHFQLCNCGQNDLRQTAAPVSMCLDVVNPMGCWEYVLSGSLYYKVGTERYRIKAGHALVMRRPDPGWLVRPVEGEPLQTLYLFVQHEPSLRTFDYLHMTYGPIQQFLEDSEVVQLAKQIVDLIHAKPRRSPYFWSEKTFEWLNAWWQDAQEHHGAWNHESLAPLKSPKLIMQTPQTVKSFADQMGYSRSYLARKLAAHWACSPGLVLRKARLREAATLLRNTQVSIGEISSRVGYSAPAAFSRAFMQVYGQSPRAYRHTHQ